MKLNVFGKNNHKSIDLESLKYPIGKFDNERIYSYKEIMEAKEYLAKYPSELISVAQNLTDDQLAKTYRPEGWTIRQVVHHIADSHMHMYIRVKFAMTEENPTIKGYNEVVWATLPDNTLPIKFSLSIIEGVHARLVALLDTMTEKDYDRTYYHGGYKRDYVLNKVIPLYHWHSKHHLEHIKLGLLS